MSDFKPTAEGKALLDRMTERRGGYLPLHEMMAELDPGFLDIFDQAYVKTMGIDPAPEAGGLQVRYRELICACACAMMPVPIEVTMHHFRAAMDAGLTEKEAIEGVHALLVPAGGIAVSNGVRALIALRKQANNNDH